MLVETGRDRSTCGFKSVVTGETVGDVWHFIPVKYLCTDCFYETGACALLQGNRYKLTRIVCRTRPSDKTVVHLHFSVVRAKSARDAFAQPLGGLVRCVESLHQKDSFSSSCVTTIGLTAMSGCTRIMRKVCCTTSLNTGAATSPP